MSQNADHVRSKSAKNARAERVIECPFKGCMTLIEKGATYSEYKSRACDHWDSHVHTHCTGIAHIIDQDGHSRYTCPCYCHRRSAR